MNDITNKMIVLKLNALWQPVGYSSVAKAIVDLAGGQSAKALDLEYEIGEDGEPLGEPVSMNPVGWEDWINLPVRPYDFAVHYANGSKVMRVPTVLVAVNFSKMPIKKFNGKPSKDSIWARDGGICQYTGKPLKKGEGNIDHVVPKDRGGRDTWENMVLADKKINSEKGNKLNNEIGLKLIREPKAPKSMPLSAMIRTIRHRDWRYFLTNIDES